MGGDRRRRPAVAAPAESGPTGDADQARQELVRSHLPLVRAVARRYGGRGEDLEELVQVGSLALVKASGRFDPDRGVAFASFAAPAVEGGIRRHLRDRSGGATRVAADTADGAEATGELDSVDESEVRVLLADGLRALDERERRIVFLRFNADMTERQIASSVGISQAHVSRLLAGALVKLRAELTPSGDATDPGADPGDTTETPPISPEIARKIEPVRARGQRSGATAQSVDGPATEAGQPSRDDRPETGAANGGPSRRSGRSKTATGYSGRILVRMPSELHEQLAQAAERDEISLNRFVTQALSTSVDPAESTPAHPADSTPAHPTGSASPGSAERPASSTARRLRLAVATNLMVVVLAGVAAIVLLVLALQRGV